MSEFALKHLNALTEYEPKNNVEEGEALKPS
jgi:hypothetical protein